MPSKIGPNGKGFFDIVTVYDEDCATLRCATSFIRTNIIAFYFAFLNHNLSSSSSLPSSAAVMFVDPSVVQAMVTFQDATIGPLGEFHSYRWIVCPLTTSVADTSGNGGHWSLVVLHTACSSSCNDSLTIDSVVAVDSAGEYNAVAANRFVALLREQHGKMLNVADTVQVSTVRDFPQQSNGYDCGAMIMLAAQRLASAATEGNMETLLGGSGEARWWTGSSDVRCRKLRATVLNLIDTIP